MAVSSDRGLCGGVHSAISKAIKRKLKTEGDKDAALVVLGDKARTQLAREAGDNIRLSFNQIGKVCYRGVGFPSPCSVLTVFLHPPERAHFPGGVADRRQDHHG